MTRNLLIYFTAAVWLVNGLVFKVLNFVPRHEEIVSRILSPTYAREFTFSIGILEVLMAAWILSRVGARICAVVQIFTVVLMNVIEIVLVPDLLLFGRMNALIALGFVFIVYIVEFPLRRDLD